MKVTLIHLSLAMGVYPPMTKKLKGGKRIGRKGKGLKTKSEQFKRGGKNEERENGEKIMGIRKKRAGPAPKTSLRTIVHISNQKRQALVKNSESEKTEDQ